MIALVVWGSPAAQTEGEQRAPASAASIAWRPFDTAAFEAARQQNKLVLLSIQAPWGHWDRLMNESTFTDPRVAAIITEKFIPVKVDALLRPDIFLRYGMGGWPTTAFLLGTGQPLYFPDVSGRVLRSGGTYYPPDTLAAYLDELARYHEANREAAEKSAEEIGRGILERKEVGDAPLTRDMLEGAATRMMEAYAGLPADATVKMGRHPDVDAIELGLYYHGVRGRGREVLDVVLRLATDMARGGIRDQVGGGFHRFATDLAWRVPAFEKPLLVNAEMLQAYTDVYKATGNGLFYKVAEGIADYVQKTLADPEGWFYAYQAADARLGEDGDYYTWTLEDARQALGDEERDLTLAAFDIGEWGELVETAPRRNVLFVQEGPKLLSERLGIPEDRAASLLDAGRTKLLEARLKRTAPPVGKVLVVEANAAMGAALLGLGDARGKQELRTAGLKAIQFALDKALVAESGLMDRAWSPETGRAGIAEIFADQVQMTRALIAAYESTGEQRWLDAARRLADTASRAFTESLEGGWTDRLYVEKGPGLLEWPMRSIRDNALFAEALVRLHHLTGEAPAGPYETAARKALKSWADEFTRYKEAAAPLGLAADRAQASPLEVILALPANGAGDEALEVKARSLYHPWKVMKRLPAAEAAARLGKVDKGAEPPSGAWAMLCMGERCAGPFQRDDSLRDRLAAFLGQGAAPPATGATVPGSAP